MSGTAAVALSLVLAAAPLLTVLLAAWVVGRAAERFAPAFGLPPMAIADLTTPVFLTALVFARVVEVLPAWRGVAANPLDLLRVTGAGQLSLIGGILGAGLGFLYFTRRHALPLLQTADVYGVALPLGVAVYSGGCLARNDCYGRVAPAPFGIVFPGLDLPHYPVGLYAAAAALFVYAGARWVARREPAPGRVALTVAMAFAGSYALLAPLRLETGPGVLGVEQAAVIAIAMAAVVAWQAAWLVRASRTRTVSPRGAAPSFGEGEG